MPLPLFLPLLLIGLPWLAFLRLQMADSVEAYSLAESAARGLLQGKVYWEAFLVMGRYIAGQVLRFREWGFLPPVVLLLVGCCMRRNHLREDPATASLFFVTLTLSLAIVGAH